MFLDNIYETKNRYNYKASSRRKQNLVTKAVCYFINCHIVISSLWEKRLTYVVSTKMDYHRYYTYPKWIIIINTSIESLNEKLPILENSLKT